MGVMQKINRILVLAAFAALIYTRLINLSWGMPYPFHPDERNMANAITQLSIKDNFNPHFFAYGQFPLYVGYTFIQIDHLLTGQLSQPVSFIEAVMSLRLISALSSIFNVFILIKIVELFIVKKKDTSQVPPLIYYLSTVIIIFSPVLIQFAHFGTTESLLMFFYTAIVYTSLIQLQRNRLLLIYDLSSIIWCGLAIATKVSSVIFLAVPLTAILVRVTALKKPPLSTIRTFLTQVVVFLGLTFFVGVIFSPHNLINWPDFLSSLSYESDVATGRYVAFYTTQFVKSIPVLFQLIKIFPYALGWPVFISSLLGFFFLTWKDRRINFLRLAVLVYFIPTAFLFAKWTRFMTPIMPLLLFFAVFFLLTVGKRMPRILFMLLIAICLIPGIAYLSIYQNEDDRSVASNWIYQNVSPNSIILSETGNVVDIPLNVPLNRRLMINTLHNYNIVPFDFYNLDANLLLQNQLKNTREASRYIFVPSRRIVANYSCQMDNNLGYRPDRCQYLKTSYPQVDIYYQKLFSGNLGFKKVAEFTSYPKIQLLGKTLIELPDERAEETWSVFDHPVIRIYKRI